MSLASRIIARLAGLPPARTYRVGVELDLRVPMPDGVELLADRYFPLDEDRAPIVLLRCPYGRRPPIGTLGRVFAERGYQAVIQSCRGTFGSGGEFYAFRPEASDGRATLEWLERQPWFGGSLAMFGPSYLGFVQWAVAADAPPTLKALAPQITSARFRRFTYPGGSFGLKTGLSWISLLHRQELVGWANVRAMLRERRALEQAIAVVPLAKTDVAMVGEPVAFFQDWLAHDAPDDPYWAFDAAGSVAKVDRPVTLLGGWYDLFLPEQLADYATLRAAGRRPYLTVGPWIHASFALLGVALSESLAWFDAHVRGDASRLRDLPVRIYVMGAKQWRHLPDWPPPATPTRWHLQPEGGLALGVPGESAPDDYTYDPADPTPTVGGIVLTRDAGPRDNRRVEARPDVLVYTSAPLERDLEVIGPISVELYARSSVEHTDFYARLCNVSTGGRSTNICDGLVRLTPGSVERLPDGVLRVRIDLWPTAYRFLRGHRVRLQVASGAHPRFARNPGSGEPLGSATTLVVAHQEICHDEGHPSAVVLPVMA
jgi:putative CocE/NonD family hydrolase